MINGIAHTALLVRDYDEAIAFYCGKLGFKVVEDTQLPNKRWIRLQAAGKMGSEILLSKAANDEQLSYVGKQAGGRVLFFFHTDDFDADYKSLLVNGIEFSEGPTIQGHGKVAVFMDLYGNRIDLIEPNTKIIREPKRVFSGAPWVSKVGYCRAIKVGNHISISGTAPIGDDGKVYAPSDPYRQACRCFEIIKKSLEELGSELSEIVRTRMFVTDISQWEAYGRAHHEYFGKHPPATTMVEIKSLIDREMMIEVEADAII